jgi:anaerobic magnesium-protoporphyrin IX monomethyl ester cyclase
MKVLMLNPPAPNNVEMVREGRCMQRKGAWGAIWPPSSLAYISGLLEKNGFNTIIKDCIAEKISKEKLKDIIKEFQPKLIICNTATPSISEDLKIAEFAKSIDKEIKIAFIGIHVTVLPDECLKSYKDIDFIIRGEPELTALEIAENIKYNKNLEKIKGTSIIVKNGKIINNPDRELIEDLDILPYPAWHNIDKNNYQLPIKGEPFFLLTTSRGCPHSCTFCNVSSYYGKKIRIRDPKKVVEEMSFIKQNLDVKNFLFWSENFSIDKEYAKLVCQEIISSGEDFSWICNSRVDTIDSKLLSLMKKAGCFMLGLGIESSSQEILDSTKKNVKLRDIRKAVYLAKKNGIEVVGHFILGLPGEDKSSLKKTIQFSIDLELDYAQYYCAVPFPGSALYDELKQNKFLENKNWCDFEQNFCVITTDKISSQEIEKIRNDGYKKFYLRPNFMIKQILNIRSPKEFLNLMKLGVEFLGWI